MTIKTGKLGEDFVSNSLAEQGWKILARNFRSFRGEVDIVALDSDSLVFIEVKNWPHGSREDLELAIGKTKQVKIIETANIFLDRNRQYNGMFVRFDVVFTRIDPEYSSSIKMEHIKDAFSERIE